MPVVKKVYLLICFMSLVWQETVSQQLVSSNGNSYKNALVQIDFALGEISIASFQQGNTSITQGVIQHSYLVSVLLSDAFDKYFSISAFPNPSSGWLQIETDFKGFNNFIISDHNGKIVLNEQFQYQLIDLSLLPKGLYFLHLTSGKGIFKNIKIEIL